MPRNTPTHASPQPPAAGTAGGRRARTDNDGRAPNFTTARTGDGLIERIVLEHARSLRPSRLAGTHGRVGRPRMLDNSPHRC